LADAPDTPVPAADPPAEPPVYAQRQRPLLPECHFRIEPDALSWTDATGRALGRVPFADFTAMRLAYAPSRFAMRRWQLELRVHDGPPVRIASQHYAGIARYEDRGAAFRPFVLALRQALQRARPDLPVHCGSTPLRWGVDAALGLLALLVLLGVVLRSVQAGPWWLALLSVALLVAALRWVLGNLLRNRPLPLASGDPVPGRVLP
jgi:hypothetical protein